MDSVQAKIDALMGKFKAREQKQKTHQIAQDAPGHPPTANPPTPPQIEGASLPERPNLRWFKIIAPVGNEQLKVTFLSPGFRGFWTHWDPVVKKPIPCEGNDRCEMCERGMGNRWTGFAAVWDWKWDCEKVLAITEGAARQLLKPLVDRPGLRALVVILHREGRQPNSPVKVHFRGNDPRPILPPDFDIMPSLERMWGITKAFCLRGRTEGRGRINAHPDDLGRVLDDQTNHIPIPDQQPINGEDGQCARCFGFHAAGTCGAHGGKNRPANPSKDGPTTKR